MRIYLDNCTFNRPFDDQGQIRIRLESEAKLYIQEKIKDGSLKMITDTEIKIKGIEALIAKLGEVQAERFISLIMREPFDYTKWQRDLWPDKSIEEISKAAMQSRGQGDLNDSFKSRSPIIQRLSKFMVGEPGVLDEVGRVGVTELPLNRRDIACFLDF